MFTERQTGGQNNAESSLASLPMWTSAEEEGKGLS